MTTLAYNRRAKFDFAIKETFEGGLQLLGTEVKSVKAGNISLKGAFITMHNNEAWLINATISPWQPKNTKDDYDPMRSRKVLLHKSELNNLLGTNKEKHLTAIPIRVYTKGSRVKIEIGLAVGKRKIDKKQALQERDIQRDIDRVIRGKDY